MLEYLVPSTTRRLLLGALWLERSSGSVRQLARRAGTSYAATHRELERMWSAGLAIRRGDGSSTVYAADLGHPGAQVLLALLYDPVREEKGAPDMDRETVLASLVAMGAPLLGVSPPTTPRADLPSDEVALVRGVELARRDATVARSLPVAFHRSARRLDIERLAHEARCHGDPHAVGMFLELAAVLGASPRLKRSAERFRDRRRTRVRDFFVATTSPLQRRLAERNTPEIARRWGYRMNLGMDAFQSTFRRFSRVDESPR